MPNEDNPPSGGTVAQASWAVRFLAGLTPSQGYMFLTLTLIGFLVWTASQRETQSQVRDDEQMSQLRRDRESEAEKWRAAQKDSDDRYQKHAERLAQSVMANCDAQEASRRTESERHMKEAMVELAKLRTSIDALAAEAARWRARTTERETQPNSPQP